MLFVVIYLVKTVLLFANQQMLDRFSKITKVPEMIVSFVFLLTGILLIVQIGGIKNLQIIKLVTVFAAIPLAVVGFKRRKKPLALLSFVLILLSYGLAEMAKKQPFIKNVVVIKGDDSSPLTHGKQVYFENCTFCHGNDGKKMYRGATDLSTGDRTADYVQLVVHDGVKAAMPMPAYGKLLSEQEINDVALFVADLKNQTVQPVTE